MTAAATSNPRTHAVMHENATNFLPFFGTDIGLCSLVKPQLNFNASLQHLSFSEKMFGPKGQAASYSREIRPGAKVGGIFTGVGRSIRDLFSFPPVALSFSQSNRNHSGHNTLGGPHTHGGTHTHGGPHIHGGTSTMPIRPTQLCIVKLPSTPVHRVSTSCSYVKL